MTTGSIAKHLIMFAIPLFIGSFFQQLYNAVDSIIVGNYVGKEALAAVGCITPIINTFIHTFGGFATGAGVVISNYYGAKDDEKLERAVQTTILSTIILCVFFTAVGVLYTSRLLQLMQTPDDVFPYARSYLRIIFFGISSMLMYNVGAGILRAVGDSTRPLYYLIICTVINTILDLVFVKQLHMGVAGAAYATVIAQTISTILVFIQLYLSDKAYRFNPAKLSIDSRILRKICAFGLPTSIQMCITAFSNVFVQSYVNRFGAAVMAGWATYVKIDAFVTQPVLALGASITTFVGQNIGARKYDRVKPTPRYAFFIGLIVITVIITPIMIFSETFVSFFSNETEVLEFGLFFVRLITPYMLFSLILQIYAGMLRGSGDSIPSMVILTLSFVVIRQIYLYIVWQISPSIGSVGFGYPIGWILCAVIISVYYYTSSKVVREIFPKDL